MNFTSKITLALAAASMLCPIAAYAGPSTGSTAAAVSIKFEGRNASGYSTIAPGGATNAGGNGVKELSAAVATGETSAVASSATYQGGTNANANGWSQPVTFRYATASETLDSVIAREYASSAQSQLNQQNQSAGSDKASNYQTANAANATNGNASNGTKGNGTSSNNSGNDSSGLSSNGIDSSSTSSNGKKSSSYSTASNNSSGNANGTSGAASDKSGSQSGNSQNGASSSLSDKTGNSLNTAKSGTSYEYTGSAAGLSYIPMIK